MKNFNEWMPIWISPFSNFHDHSVKKLGPALFKFTDHPRNREYYSSFSRFTDSFLNKYKNVQAIIFNWFVFNLDA